MMRTLRFTALALIAFVRAAEGDSTIAPVVVTAAGGGVDPQATCRATCESLAQQLEVTDEAQRQAAKDACLAGCQVPAGGGPCAAKCPAGVCDSEADAKKPECFACAACQDAQGDGGDSGDDAPVLVTAAGGGLDLLATCRATCEVACQNEFPCAAKCPAGVCDSEADAKKPECADCAACQAAQGGDSDSGDSDSGDSDSGVTIAPVIVTAAGGGLDLLATCLATCDAACSAQVAQSAAGDGPTAPMTSTAAVTGGNTLPPVTAAPTEPASADLDFDTIDLSVLTQVDAAVSAIEACATTLETAGEQAQAPCSAAFEEGKAKAVGDTCGAQADACEEGKLCPACKTDDCHAALRGIDDAEIQRIAAACSTFEKAAPPLIKEFVGCVDAAVGVIDVPEIRAAFKADFETPPKPDTPTSPEQLRFELFKFANECGLKGLTLTPPSKAELAAQAKQASQKVSQAKVQSTKAANAAKAAKDAVTAEENKLDAKVKEAIQGKTGQAARDAAKAVADADPTLDAAAVDSAVLKVQEKQTAAATAEKTQTEAEQSVTSAKASQTAVSKTSADAQKATTTVPPASGSGASVVAATAGAAAAAGVAMMC